MKIRPEILDHWPEVSARLPAGLTWKHGAVAWAFTRAQKSRTLRPVAAGACIWRLGMSLREDLCVG